MNSTVAVRNYAKVGDSLPIPGLLGLQTAAYARFLQEDVAPLERKAQGLEALLREMFPLESYDGNLSLHYISYELGKARFTPDSGSSSAM